MEQSAEIKSPDPLSAPWAYHNDLIRVKEIIQRHEYLLYRIAVTLGCNDCESEELVRIVRLEAWKSYSDENIHLPLRIWLVKVIVHKCIFKISCQLFSRQNIEGITINSEGLHEYSGFAASSSRRLQEMPLSYKVAYILNTMFPFTEKDVAEILNITPFKLKERLYKAEAFMKDQSRKKRTFT